MKVKGFDISSVNRLICVDVLGSNIDVAIRGNPEFVVGVLIGR